jgi:hypothetical protein
MENSNHTSMACVAKEAQGIFTSRDFAVAFRKFTLGKLILLILRLMSCSEMPRAVHEALKAPLSVSFDECT